MATRSNREPGMPPEHKGRANGSGKWSRYQRASAGLRCTWGDVDGALLVGVLDTVVNAGDAILLGGTRDGTCLVATVISGEERLKLYGRSGAEMSQELSNLRSSYEE